MMMINLRSLLYQISRKLALFDAGIMGMKRSELSPYTDNKRVWLGKGYRWQAYHSQLLHDLLHKNIDKLKLPAWAKVFRRSLTNVKGKVLVKNNTGATWIQGLEPVEENIFIPIESFKGHTIILATNRSVKTRMLSLLAAQAVRRQPNEAIILFDLKGDLELKNLLKAAAIDAGRGDDFYFFHPAFPDESCAMDPVKNYNRATEIASRVSDLMSGDGDNAAFQKFAWRILEQIVAGLLLTGEKPTIVKMKQYIESGVQELLFKVIQYEAEKVDPYFKDKLVLYINDYDPDVEFCLTKTNMAGLIKYYNNELKAVVDNKTIDGLLTTYNHPREHAQKMLANILPLLVMLTSGNLEQLLSPDPADATNNKPIMDMKKIVDSKAICYIGLDALSDNIVAASIGQILLSDLASVAGDRYNHEKTHSRINLFIDEAHSLANEAMLSLANQGAGAGIEMTLLTQTVNDFAVSMGSMEAANKLLGNMNNIIAGRVLDGNSQEFVSEKFGKTYIDTRMTGLTEGSGSGIGVADWSDGFGERETQAEVDVIPKAILGKIPNLEYIAMFTGGDIIKAKIPILVDES